MGLLRPDPPQRPRDSPLASMEDLQYIFTLGFSGSDFWRALWIGLLASLFASRKFRPWKVCILAFMLDRIWPFYGMWYHGSDNDAIISAVFATIGNFPQDITYYIVRYLGILGLVYLGYNLRRFLHGYQAPVAKPKSSGVYPY